MVTTSIERSLKMIAGAFYIPKDSKLKPLGEDAHFICAEEQTIGVADGVGGWARKGVDAGEYARKLLANAVYAVEDQPEGSVDLKKVLNEAFLNTEARGSSTACILTLKGDCLHAVNVGDSGFVVIRGGKIIYQSPVQQHRFNSPYQLGNTADSPSLAEEFEVVVEAGDIVVAGTDGLFDNLHPAEIEDVVSLCLRKRNMPELLAWTMAKVARKKSLDEWTDSPFAMAAYDAGVEHLGGKYDDITVIVTYILSPNLF
ncbi:unnamed protein product [Ilex paraguariensis]|uniref:Protein phosphatase n=1 Tax=Ilex paraguariensis TaxID=185542 RepID=A0ABC8UED4_9AQUA